MRPDLDLLDLPPDPPSSGEPVTIFYDGEFTDLTPDSDLLSIAFTACDSNTELYIEIADAEIHRSSEFVKAAVLPLFGRHNPEVLTRYKAAERIVEWLDGLRDGDRQRQIVMVSDSQWDWAHFLELFPASSPGGGSWAQAFNLVGRTVQMMLASGRQYQAYTEAVEDYFRRHQSSRHHALVDSRALKAAYLESRFS